jgi:hypothetical protein
MTQSLIDEITEAYRDEGTGKMRGLVGHNTTGEEIQWLLEGVMSRLRRVDALVEGKVSVEFLLRIVSAYHIGGAADDITVVSPGVLFDEDLLPNLDKLQVHKEQFDKAQEEVTDDSTEDS